MRKSDLRILYLRKTPCDSDTRSILQQLGELDEKNLSRVELVQAIENYHAILTDLEHYFDEAILTRAPKLRILASASTGLDHIDLDYCRRNSIEVLSLESDAVVLNKVSATAELTFALILSLVRKITAAHRSVTEGIWDRERFRTYELQGKVLGIIGYGRLGKMVARYAQAFDMAVLVTDPYLKDPPQGISMIPLEDLLGGSDIVTVHVRLTEDTRGLIGREEFSMMKTGAWFVNTSRGLLVDEDALLESLETGKLRGAALDVLAGEERRASAWLSRNKLVDYARRHDNLLITPHIGGSTLDSKKKVNKYIAELMLKTSKQREQTGE
jgi:D-3-phosphoglycerate dehydrogenase